MDFISSSDGVSTTILLSENVTATGAQSRASWAPFPNSITNENDLKSYELTQVVLWRTDFNVNPNNNQFWGFKSPPPQDQLYRNLNTWQAINTGANNVNFSAFTPSATHAGGFVVAYCDGHVKFMSDLVAYDVYARAMTPNGALAREPGVDRTANNVPSPAWQLNPISERDLDP